MPLAGVSDAAKEYHAKKAAAEQGGTVFFKLSDGEERTVRFLEEGEDFTTYYVHRLPQQGSRFPQIPCLDQSPRPSGRIPCPGCEDGHKRSFRFAINLICRDAPVPKRNEDKKVVRDGNGNIVYTDRREDQVMVWTGGIEVAEDLDHLDGKFGGLSSRDFEIQRSGVKLDTKYRILPSGERQPLTPREQELAKQRYDLNQFKKPPDYEQFYSYGQFNGGGSGGGGSDSESSDADSVGGGSPFRRRNRAD